MFVKPRPLIAAVLAVTLVMADPAQAYMGPGLGLGALSTAFGFVAALLLGIVSLVWYPFKRMIRAVRRRGRGK